MKAIDRIHNSVESRYLNFLRRHFPYYWVKYRYKIELGRVADFSHPKDINEKILWLEFFTDTTKWSILADKYSVRDFVKESIGDRYLVTLLGKWERVEDIDFNSLPEKFVIKPNNGSYDTIIVNDKSITDLVDIRKRLCKSLQSRFGYDNGEIHYLRIKPYIIAEELLETNDPLGLVDYKIWCFDGKPYCIFVCLGRDPVTHHAEFTCYDMDWNWRPDMLHPDFRSNQLCPKPENLIKMIEMASKLSKGLPQCRVDLYNIEGKIYFGEMTLTSNYGMMPYFTQEVLDEMGDLCILPKRNIRERAKCFFNRYCPRF